jgi:hypothetical protein
MRWASSSCRSSNCRRRDGRRCSRRRSRAHEPAAVRAGGTLERIVRQHLILDDSALIDDYDRLRQEFRATANQLALLPLGEEPLAALDALTDSESRLHKLLVMPQRSADTQASWPTDTRGSPIARRRCSVRRTS